MTPSLSYLVQALEKMFEPVPDKEVMEQYPSYRKSIHRPDFLLIKARKNEQKTPANQVSLTMAFTG